jgi:hypothetical protein
MGQGVHPTDNRTLNIYLNEMNFIKKRRSITKASSGQDVVLTAELFIEKQYISSKSLLQFVDGGRIEDVQELEALFDLTKEGLKISLPRHTRKDRGGLDYKYATFLRANGPDGVKVIMLDNIDEFMIAYRDKQFTTNFTLEELVSEAEKA